MNRYFMKNYAKKKLKQQQVSLNLPQKQKKGGLVLVKSFFFLKTARGTG